MNLRRALAWLVPVLVLASVPPVGAADVADGGRATVASVVDGDTVVLGDGRQVRLPGLQAPKLPLGRKGFKAWPLGGASKAYLQKLLSGRDVFLRYGGARRDRHGRVLAHLYRDDGGGKETWVQGAMLSAGMARMYTFPDNRALVADMRVREAEARRADRGIWGLDFYAVRRPDALADDVGTFQLVEGVIRAAAEVKGVVYLNFGEDWRTDFTVRIQKRDLKAFHRAGLDPAAWTGRRIEARGWVARRNGPMITATHPEQLYLLPP